VACVLLAIIAILTTVASAGGVFIDDLYRDDALATPGWRGTGLATLVIGGPTGTALPVGTALRDVKRDFESGASWQACERKTLYVLDVTSLESHQLARVGAIPLVYGAVSDQATLQHSWLLPS
jgi:hypothetical protein